MFLTLRWREEHKPAQYCTLQFGQQQSIQHSETLYANHLLCCCLAGGTRHWERVGASGKGLDSLEVEMTSYVLLALLSGPALPGFDLDYSAGIVHWLSQQQNPYGGFSSTQVGHIQNMRTLMLCGP